MDRSKYLASEIFSYSYQNYANHLGIGHARYEKLMPDDAATLERAEKGGWSDERVSKELECDLEEAKRFRQRHAEAVAIVDSSTPASGLREALRQSFDAVLGDRRVPDHEIEGYIDQACYRVSDFIFRMQDEGKDWKTASDELREES